MMEVFVVDFSFAVSSCLFWLASGWLFILCEGHNNVYRADT